MEFIMPAKLTYIPCEFEEGTWSTFRDDIKKVEPELFKLIEQISPNNTFKLIKARYAYGEKITDLGTIRVPNDTGKLVRLDDSTAPLLLKEQLGYCPTPLIVQLKSANEVFVELEDRIIPLNVFMPGDLYGLYEILVPYTNCPVVPCWSITSGGRSVFLTAKVSDSIGHKKLRTEFGVSAVAPRKLIDQWNIIKTIANRDKTDIPWNSEVLIFTKNWFKNENDDINWLKFRNYLFGKAWWQSRGNRVQIEYSIMWEAFSKAVCSRNLKPNSYIVDTIKHLFLLTTSTAPAFKIAEDDTVLPANLIEKAYTDVYGLKDLAPIIMHPQILGAKKSIAPIYYSMAYPTLLVGTPAIRKIANIMTEMREVKILMATLEKVLESQAAMIFKPIKDIKFEYFHSDNDNFGEILNSESIAEIDTIIKLALDTKFKGKKFPSYGNFFRGCIRISK